MKNSNPVPVVPLFTPADPVVVPPIELTALKLIHSPETFPSYHCNMQLADH
jgi:hypothetical protein